MEKEIFSVKEKRRERIMAKEWIICIIIITIIIIGDIITQNYTDKSVEIMDYKLEILKQ